MRGNFCKTNCDNEHYEGRLKKQTVKSIQNVTMKVKKIRRTQFTPPHYPTKTEEPNLTELPHKHKKLI